MPHTRGHARGGYQSLEITVIACYYLTEFCEVSHDLGVRLQLIPAQVRLQVMSTFLAYTHLGRRLLLELFEGALVALSSQSSFHPVR